MKLPRGGNDELGRAGEVAGCVWGPCPLGGENKRKAPCAWWRRPVAWALIGFVVLVNSNNFDH